MSAGANILKFADLQVGYDTPLLQRVNAGFGTGITGIIGNNGKGKTTLLKCTCGLLKPLHGSITFNEKDVSMMTNNEKARRISFNFSSNPVSFPMSVYELVSMGRYPYINNWAGLSAEDERVVEESMQLCGINSFRDKKITALSDGERQKVFIAKSLAQQTPIMLFDEPTAFLDHSSKKYFFNLVKDISARQNKIVLVSSHDIDFLISYADNLLMIADDGSVLVNTTSEITGTSYFKTHFTKA